MLGVRMRQEYSSKSFMEIVELIQQSVKPSPEVNVHVSLDLLFMVLEIGGLSSSVKFEAKIQLTYWLHIYHPQT